MMKLSFDKRLDEGMMKMYCVDYQINKKSIHQFIRNFITPTSVGNGSGITGENGACRTYYCERQKKAVSAIRAFCISKHAGCSDIRE